MACPPTPLLVSQPSNLTFPTPSRTRIWHHAQTDNHVEGITWLISLPNPWQPNTVRSHILMISRRFFLLNSGILSISWERNWITFTSRMFYSRIGMWIVQFATTIDTTTRKIIVAYNTSNHRFPIEIVTWSTTPIPRDNGLCHFRYYDVVLCLRGLKQGTLWVAMSSIQLHYI